MNTYKIVRKFFREGIEDEVVETELTLEQAKAHCNSSESSSKTAKGSNKAITEKYGHWFDSFYEEHE